MPNLTVYYIRNQITPQLLLDFECGLNRKRDFSPPCCMWENETFHLSARESYKMSVGLFSVYLRLYVGLSIAIRLLTAQASLLSLVQPYTFSLILFTFLNPPSLFLQFPSPLSHSLSSDRLTISPSYFRSSLSVRFPLHSACLLPLQHPIIPHSKHPLRLCPCVHWPCQPNCLVSNRPIRGSWTSS